MTTTNYINGSTLTDAGWFNDVDAHVYELFGATGGKAFIGDSANAKLTIGLTINQAGNDDEILALKSSDVDHGVTDIAETDTYGTLRKQNAAGGGLNVRGFTEGLAGVEIQSINTSEATSKNTSANGSIILEAILKSGTGTTTLGADGNLAVIKNAGTTRFIFDAEGSFHADVESTTFDAYDDLALVEAMDREFQRRNGTVKDEYMAHLMSHRQTLQDLGIVNYYDPEGKRAMVNVTKQAMLHNGAIRQLAGMLEKALLKIEQLEMKLLNAD